MFQAWEMRRVHLDQRGADDFRSEPIGKLSQIFGVVVADYDQRWRVYLAQPSDRGRSQRFFLAGESLQRKVVAMKLQGALAIDRINLAGSARRAINPVLRLHLPCTIEIALLNHFE